MKVVEETKRDYFSARLQWFALYLCALFPLSSLARTTEVVSIKAQKGKVTSVLGRFVVHVETTMPLIESSTKYTILLTLSLIFVYYIKGSSISQKRQ